VNADNLLCYEMNGAPLPPDHGAPVRLIAPDWYGVADVKWLTRIEITDSRFQGGFMVRDHVSIREEQSGTQTVWTFTSVTHERLKSAPAKVTRLGDHYTVLGAAWGAPIAKVRAQIDNGPWQATKLIRNPSPTTNHDDSAWSLGHRTGELQRRASTRSGLGPTTTTATSSPPPGPLPHQPKNVLREQRTDHSSRAHHQKEAVCSDGSGDRSICSG
jgi:DMSO/TMAO reductase YedYZ molybdopterin-dependent catalytic subunit